MRRRRHRGLEEYRHSPREVPPDIFRWPGLGRFGVQLFGLILLGAILLGIISLIPDIAAGRFTVTWLGGLALFALSAAVLGTTVITSVFGIAGVLGGRKQARRLRTRQDPDHHP